MILEVKILIVDAGNLDLASSQNRIAEEKARELKTLNKSMFAVVSTMHIMS